MSTPVNSLYPLPPAAQQFAASRPNGVNGAAMRALAIKYRAKWESLQATGQAKPATLINFNPVAVRPEGPFNFKAPSIVDASVPEESKMVFSYKGKKHKATIMVVKYPHLYPWIKDVKQPEGGDMADGVGVHDIEACYPIEIMHEYWASCNGSAMGTRMGGVVIYEGDRHVVGKKELPEFVQVPTFSVLPDNRRQYFTQERKFSEFMAEQLDMQRAYCEGQIVEGSLFYDDETRRRNITQVHRIWHQFGLDMGWVQNARAWLQPIDAPNQESCKGCGTPKKNALAWFCPACARPYVPVEAYLAGELPFEQLTGAYVMSITEADRPRIMAEEKRRNKLRASFQVEDGK